MQELDELFHSSMPDSEGELEPGRPETREKRADAPGSGDDQQFRLAV